MHVLKAVAKVILNILAIIIFVYLNKKDLKKAGWFAFSAILVTGLLSAWCRTQIFMKDFNNKYLFGTFFLLLLAPWTAFAISVIYIGIKGLQESFGTQKIVLYISLAFGIALDTYYMYLRRREQKSSKLRVATYAFAFVLYANVAVSIYYLDIILRFNKPLYETLTYPPKHVRDTICGTKTHSTDGTPLIWSITETNDVRCAYQTWEHLRSNILFLITFSIGCSLLFDFERTKNSHSSNYLLARVLGLFSYALQFAGYTNIIDSLDELWTVSNASLGLLCAHFGLNIVVAFLRYRNAEKHKNQNSNQSDSEDDETQQPPTDETPLMVPLEHAPKLNLSAVMRHRRFAQHLDV